MDPVLILPNVILVQLGLNTQLCVKMNTAKLQADMLRLCPKNNKGTRENCSDVRGSVRVVLTVPPPPCTGWTNLCVLSLEVHSSECLALVGFATPHSRGVVFYPLFIKHESGCIEMRSPNLAGSVGVNFPHQVQLCQKMLLWVVVAVS